MTNPTAKGYTAPTVEEMKKAAPAVNICVDPNCDTCATGERLDAENESISQASQKSKAAPEDEFCVWCGRVISGNLSTKAAPDSEDEAFEEAWRERNRRGNNGYSKEEFRAGWNARARLDAERGGR
jgi:quinolinate synthase